MSCFIGEFLLLIVATIISCLDNKINTVVIQASDDEQAEGAFIGLPAGQILIDFPGEKQNGVAEHTAAQSHNDFTAPGPKEYIAIFSGALYNKREQRSGDAK